MKVYIVEWGKYSESGILSVFYRRAYITVAQADMFRVPIGEQKEPPPG